MKILIVSAYDIRGGAHKAAYRLHEALLSDGHDSQMLVQQKFSNDSRVLTSFGGKYKKILAKTRFHLDQLPVKLYSKRTNTLFSVACLPSEYIVTKINEINPDIVHFHWICDGMIKTEDLLKIERPLFFSLHDMWLFTAGCHYHEGCENYKDECRYCKVLNQSKKCVLSKLTFIRKYKTLSNLKNITIIGLSNWITNLAKESKILAHNKIFNLPNLINVEQFYPQSKKDSRNRLGLPINRKLVLCGATTFDNNPRKGIIEIVKSFSLINNDNIELVFFGEYDKKLENLFKQKVYFLGYIEDEKKQQVIYNAADLTLVPSHQENLSLVIMESLSCGTPVVAFDIGGNKDMIEHKRNGYLAQPFSIEDLKEGVEWVLYNDNYEKLSYNARQKVLNEFDSKIVVKKYIKLYQEVLIRG